MKSNLVGKANIRILELNWRQWWDRSSGNFLDQDILEGLQPPPKLESLTIQNFMGSKFASWMMSDSLPINLTEIELDGCQECEEVPPLGHLPNLRSILFQFMEKLKCVGDEFYGYKYVKNDDAATKVTLFPALKSLTIEHCPALSEWKEAVVEKVMSTGEKAALVVFPCLEQLTILFCRELRSAPTHFPSLRGLTIWGVDNAMPIENICSGVTTLTSLRIYRMKELTCLPVGMGEKNHNLRELRIENCEKLLTVSGCPSLRELRIEECNEFTSILSKLTSLRTLNIRSCPNLRTLSGHGLHSCTSLATLSVSDCYNLTSLADQDMSGLQSLSSLHLYDCRKLQCLPKGLHSLSHLKVMHIGAFWEELDSFPDFQVPSQLEILHLYGWPKLNSLPQQIQHSTSLTYLCIKRFDGVEDLPDWFSEWLGNLASNCAGILEL